IAARLPLLRLPLLGTALRTLNASAGGLRLCLRALARLRLRLLGFAGELAGDPLELLPGLPASVAFAVSGSACLLILPLTARLPAGALLLPISVRLLLSALAALFAGTPGGACGGDLSLALCLLELGERLRNLRALLFVRPARIVKRVRGVAQHSCELLVGRITCAEL